MKNGIYKDEIRVITKSVFGSGTRTESWDTIAGDCPIINGFLADNDTQEMTLVSANMGIISTYQKAYR